MVAAFLRHLPVTANPFFFEQLQFTCGILAFTFAGMAFVRFQGARDRLSLILAASFVMIGVTLVSSSFGVAHPAASASGAMLRDPLNWVVGRTLLGVLLVAALVVEKRNAWSRHPDRDIAFAFAVVILLTALLSVSHRFLPADVVLFHGSYFPRPGNLIPAGLFLAAAVLYRRRLKQSSSSFDHALYLCAVINCWCSIAAAESAWRLDAAFALAATLGFLSYAVLLGGALFDITHLFRDIQWLATTDSVTGLANYRRLIECLELEIQRTGRTGRPFAFLLFDLDGLKRINDQCGHLVGTRALVRAADVLRSQCRAIDTGARHGGDEFALVLPETSEQGAQEVLSRVCSRVANDGEQPSISLSAGFAIYPRDADTIAGLMDAADRALYQMKGQLEYRSRIVKQAAV
jgi:diguanylate cyclase (GGDEF)-like protein